MYKGIEVIGIDHGWSYMKTISHVFVTGVEEIATEPAFTKNLLEFGGKFYKIGGTRLEVQDVKTKNDNFFLLTLAAIAKELKSRGTICQKDRARGVNRALKRMVDYVAGEMKNPAEKIVAISHCNCPDAA